MNMRNNGFNGLTHVQFNSRSTNPRKTKPIDQKWNTRWTLGTVHGIGKRVQITAFKEEILTSKFSTTITN